MSVKHTYGNSHCNICAGRCMAEPHDCIDHLQLQQHEWIEPHGEPCYQEWFVCTWCAETFTEAEVDRLIQEA